MKRYICIHGHFYQPPRENPWLEEIEYQDSAYPYQDWNQRILAECYAANMASRVLDPRNQIIDIVNNYARISFNFGPSLFSWLGKKAPEVYQAILEADKISQKNFSGHGSAIAQAYNHMIMPLANERDKKTQILWGIKDFEARFKRKPEGFWLPETAVDLTTLSMLAQEGIKFTILGPHQAKRVRKIAAKDWQDVEGGKINPQVPYLCALPSGEKIAIFFYDGPISREIAFGNLLNNGEVLARRLLETFPKEMAESRLVHIANDGETYGHHHPFGNMALSYLLRHIETNHLAQITIYGEYLAKNPPQDEVEIIENSSWSCFHGVERWQANCGCHTGRHPDWHQEWRKPLREAMDYLRDELSSFFEEKMAGYTEDPWKMRDHYIQVVLDRSIENVNHFLSEHARGELTREAKIQILKLLEIQRHGMLMYTSCGWFFEDISGIETLQILQYSARAIQLAKEIDGLDLETTFLHHLESAKSNVPDLQDGRKIYETLIRPEIIDLVNVGAHYAISSLFEKYSSKTNIYTYTIEPITYDEQQSGKQKLILGEASIFSEITWEETVINFAALHLGDHNVNAGVCRCNDDTSFKWTPQEIKTAFMDNHTPEVIQLIIKHFGEHNYFLWDLFKNDQGKVLEKIFEDTLQSIEAHYRQIYEDYAPLMRIRKLVHAALPKSLAMTVEFVLNRKLTDLLEEKEINLSKLEKLCLEIKQWAFVRDKQTVAAAASQRIAELMGRFAQEPYNVTLLETIDGLLKALSILSLPLDFGLAQNIYFALGKKIYPVFLEKSKTTDSSLRKWLDHFKELGTHLQVNINAFLPASQREPIGQGETIGQRPIGQT